MGSSSDDAATVDEIKAAVLALDEAYANHDINTIKRLTSPDHVSLAANYGKPITLAEQLETLAEFLRHPFDFSPVEVTLLGGEAALVNFENSLRGTWRGKPLSPRVYVTEIWLKLDDQWRQRLYQETPLTSP